MILTFKDAGKQISPCMTLNQAASAHGLKTKPANNTRKCIPSYWERTVETIGRQAFKSYETIEAAKKNHNEYVK